ncbi:MAG: hypothetical protein JWQ46_640 [Phenylobacterium sp.]|nr:hypothetical protein [Phenylobacterium sp.]
MTLHDVSHWLESTPLSRVIQEVTWVIPLVQSIHILAIAAVMSSVLLLDLRLAGVVGRDDPIGAFSNRYLPWIWWGVLVLLITGSTLVVGEPKRALENPTFGIKMCLLAAVLVITAVFQRPLRTDKLYWASPSRRLQIKALAWASLGLWAAIVVCGRWIAYSL